MNFSYTSKICFNKYGADNIMIDRPKYKKTFTRECSLALIEMWWRAETINDKKWTNKKQPFSPYIIFEKVNDIINVYYDKRGTNWTEKTIIGLAKSNKNFIKNIGEKYHKHIEQISTYYNYETLTHNQLKNFKNDFEEAWIWFDAAWWFWELEPKEYDGIVLPKSFMTLREETQDFGQKADEMIMASLQKLYSKVSKFVDVLLFSEIINNDIPSERELLKRKKGFFYTNNKLLVNLSRKDIEKKYLIQFEKIKLEKNLTHFKGTPASKGKAIGKTKIVLSAKKIDKVDHDDILVSPMTTPDFVPAMHKASAIVTDEGGVLCHAAIIARELGKPCIVGTNIATKVLKDGDIIEVDADAGIITRLKNDRK